MTITPEPALTKYLGPVITELKTMGESIWNFRSELFQGLVILVVLLVIAKFIRMAISITFRRLSIDALAEKGGLSCALGKVGIKAPISKVISSLVYWMIALYAVKTAAGFWGVADISNFINSFILFLPKLFISAFILFGGLMLGELVRNAIEAKADEVGIDHGAVIGNLIYGLIAVIIFTVVLGQLGIETDLLNSAVKILLAAIGLVVALSLGLGLRQIASNIVSGVYARDLFPPGSALEIDERVAVVQEVGAIATRLQASDGSFVVIPNSTLVSQVNRGRSRVQEFAEKF